MCVKKARGGQKSLIRLGKALRSLIDGMEGAARYNDERTFQQVSVS